ncbi:glycerate kinase [Nonomuraea cavernae]|uniref:Glycerate kinase n=1 Tax=Nonomuraea cavernae TaxID=2045107 RepID=A0A918DSM2_9ACTN|nr:glycerate kinase [Nonomuraea cavernae]MCA2190669.1 glycerate kinase [Nonomuraea cavernae]GGO81851.1 glycerate kinase [Nonomuraea cavernae]
MVDHVLVAPDKFKGSLTAAEVAARVAAGLGVPAVELPVADGGDGTVDAVVACGFTRITREVTGPTGRPVQAAYAWHPTGHPAGDRPAGSAPPPTRDVGRPSGDVRPPERDIRSPAPDVRPSARDARSPTPDARPSAREPWPSARDARPTAVIELAEASGLRRLPGDREPLTATSYGTGELIADAVERGARRVVLGLGGSACTDGGAGMVQALGARLLDTEGRELGPGGAALRELDRIDLAAFPDVSGVEFVVASDVDNPLLGPHGAAAVYGPQKGATADDVRILEAALGRLAAVATRTHGLVGAVEHDGAPRPMGVAGAPGAGAAGGVGFAALAFLRADIRPGIDYLLDLLGFGEFVQGARLVIVGEGSLDEQSLRGKAPVGVAQAAAKAGVPVVAVCGRRTLSDAELQVAGIKAAYALTDLEPDPVRCMAEAGPLLERLAARLAADRL